MTQVLAVVAVVFGVTAAAVVRRSYRCSRSRSGWRNNRGGPKAITQQEAE
jgi:hypothetical protein